MSQAMNVLDATLAMDRIEAYLVQLEGEGYEIFRSHLSKIFSTAVEAIFHEDLYEVLLELEQMYLHEQIAKPNALHAARHTIQAAMELLGVETQGEVPMSWEYKFDDSGEILYVYTKKRARA